MEKRLQIQLPLREIIRRPDRKLRNNQLYVLTNHRKINGAAVILYPEMLKELSNRFLGGFYIIPSSIHEVIFVPDRDDIDPSALLNMIIDVNDSQVPKEDILSYNLYYYDVTLHKIKVINNVKQKIL